MLRQGPMQAHRAPQPVKKGTQTRLAPARPSSALARRCLSLLPASCEPCTPGCRLQPIGAAASSSAATSTAQQEPPQGQGQLHEVLSHKGSSVKDVSQAYINKFVQPLSSATLRVYKAHEAVFDELLITPDLDKQLHHNKSLQWATATVEAAVANAISVAYSSSSSSNDGGNSNNGSIDSQDMYIKMSDGMGTVAAARAAQLASPQLSQQQQQQQTAAVECNSTNDDDQCEVDWDALYGSLEDANDDDGIDREPVGASTAISRGSSASGSSMDGCADTLAAAAAVKVEAATGEAFDAAAAHTFLQRVLYKINRLNHFWYDDLSNYVNERSAWLAKVRDTIEEAWQAWEVQQMEAAAAAAAVEGSDEVVHLADYQTMSREEMKQALKDRYARDVAPPLLPSQQYVVERMSPLGYCHLLAVGSVDGLVEASRQSRVCAGVANEVACAIFRVLMEEYGTGRYTRKHSTFYKAMMEELGLNTREEHYLDLLPWQWLAAGNHNFLLTERRRNYLRYAGALSFFEINGPSVYKTYLAAGQRCGLSESACGYWALHIKEDERHGRQMLEEVALPLVDMYPDNAWELLWGYDQDRFMGARAGAALVAHIQAANALAWEVAAAASKHRSTR